jgi:hypothetical protein
MDTELLSAIQEEDAYNTFLLALFLNDHASYELLIMNCELRKGQNGNSQEHKDLLVGVFGHDVISGSGRQGSADGYGVDVPGKADGRE